MGDLSPSPPVRIEPSSPGEDRNARERSAPKPIKPVAAMRNHPPTPDVDFEAEELNKDEKHKLDERA
jgi:hypothetical protein